MVMTIIADSPALATTPRSTGFDEVLELPLTVAIRSAAAMLAVMRDDKISPVLNSAHFDGARLLASDRYRCAKYDLPSAPDRADDRLLLGAEFLIPDEALLWVTRVKPDKEKRRTKLATMSDAGYTIRYTKIDRHVAVELIDMFGVAEAESAFDVLDGNFPPLMKLFGERTPATVVTVHGFDPALLTSLFQWASKHGGGEPARLTVTEKRGFTDKSPISDAATIACGAATFLIQPMKLDS